MWFLKHVGNISCKPATMTNVFPRFFLAKKERKIKRNIGNKGSRPLFHIHFSSRHQLNFRYSLFFQVRSLPSKCKLFRSVTKSRYTRRDHPLMSFYRCQCGQSLSLGAWLRPCTSWYLFGCPAHRDMPRRQQRRF